VSWARIGYAAEARNVKMLSRKRNVFLEPSQLEGDALEALQVGVLEPGTGSAVTTKEPGRSSFVLPLHNNALRHNSLIVFMISQPHLYSENYGSFSIF
jgi:hypothetical protein